MMKIFLKLCMPDIFAIDFLTIAEHAGNCCCNKF